MSPRAARLAVALLVIWGFALRAWLAWPEPNRHRFWDERFALANIVHLLSEGRIEPVNGYHPALSWLPTGAFLAAARAGHGLIRSDAPDPFLHRHRGQLPALYRTGRLFHVALGALSIWLSWRLGRGLGGRTTGVLAAAFTAFLPRHVLSSCLINEDMPLVVGCQVALLASAAAVRGGRWGAYVRAGVAIGAALATKFVAAPVSLPLVAATARLPVGWGGRLRRVAVAAVIAAVTLLAVSPHLLLATDLYRRDFGETSRLYELKEAEVEQAGGNIVLGALAMLAGKQYFGAGGALLALAGALVASGWALRRTGGWRRAAAVIALFPPLFVVLYAAVTGHARPHAWLPVAPVVAAFAALGARELLRRLSSWRAPLGGWLAGLVVLGTLAAIAGPAHATAYEQTTPTCAQILLRVDRGALRGSPPRLIAVDRELADELGKERPLSGDRTAYVTLEEPMAEDVARRFDALLLGSDAARVAEGSEERRCEPRPFRSRGTAARLVTPSRPRLRPTGLVARAAAPGTIEFEIPAAARAGDPARLEIRLPRRAERERASGRLELRLEVGGAPLLLHSGRDPEGGPMLISEYYELAVEPQPARLLLTSRSGWAPGKFAVRLWSTRPRGGAADQSPASSGSSSPRSARASAAAAKSAGIRSPGRGR